MSRHAPLIYPISGQTGETICVSPPRISDLHTLHPHTSTHSYVEGEDSYPHHLSILPTYMNVEGGDSYPHHLSILPTYLNVGGGDSYPHQLSVLPRITHLDVEGGESLPLQVAAWPHLGDPQNQNSRETSVCEGHDVPRPPEEQPVFFQKSSRC